MEKLVGISLASNSYWSAGCTAYFENATLPNVATLGLTPAIPAMKKYVDLKSNNGEKVKAVMLEAALISISDQYKRS